MHVDAEGLQLAADDVGAVARRRLEDAERDGIDADDEERARVVGQARDLRGLRLDRPEVAGVLDVDARGVVTERCPQRVEVEQAGCAVEGHELEVDPRPAVAAHHGETLRRDRGRHERLPPPGDAPAHAERRCGGARPVVRRLAHGVELHELADQARVLEEGLQLAVVRVALAVVGGEELAAVDDLVDDRRDVVLPAAAAQEAQGLPAAAVAREHRLEVAPQLELRAERRLERQRAPEAQALGDGAVELVDVRGADLA